MSESPARRASALLLAPLMLATAAAADVHILRDGTTYPTIQAAVDAARDGDLLTVDAGIYDGFVIDDKSLSIFVDEGTVVDVIGESVIKNLAPRRTVALVGLVMVGLQGAPFTLTPDSALVLVGNQGAVRIQDCALTGGEGYQDFGSSSSFGPGGIGLAATLSVDVALIDSTFIGGLGGGGDYFQGTGAAGGFGVLALNCAVAAYDCEFRGGEGGSAGTNGGDGGIGYRVQGLGLFASGSLFRGGQGGATLDFICFEAGDGGDGLYVAGQGTAARLYGNTYAGGAGGPGLCCCANGSPGVGKFWTGGPLHQISPFSRSLDGPRVTADESPFNVEVRGEPGDRVFLMKATRTHFLFTVQGVWLVPLPALMLVDDEGTIPGSGTLSIPVYPGALSAAVPGRVLHLQAYIVDAQGHTALGTASQTLVLNL